jgi:phosphoribosylanthranilate isomerase
VSTPGTRIKFCGITNVDDAQAAVAAGAWAVGMIFWRGSRRRCRPTAAVEIAAALRRQVELAGVFVNAPLDVVTATAEDVGLTLVQLHGDEGPAYCAEVSRRTGARVIKAGRIRTGADVQALGPFHTDFHLLDSYQAGVPGGTGTTFAWEMAANRRTGPPVLLSGGLNPENVGQAIAAVRPFAVDVASGVEATPGTKDHARLSAFAAAVRAADAGAAAHADADADADAA